MQKMLGRDASALTLTRDSSGLRLSMPVPAGAEKLYQVYTLYFMRDCLLIVVNLVAIEGDRFTGRLDNTKTDTCKYMIPTV